MKTEAPPLPASPDAALRQVAPRRTQIERRTEAEARLLAAAREIVARKGWVGMTLAEVGETAGYSRGLAAHHFGSKPSLLRALASHINDNFMRELDGGPQRRDGLDALLGFVQTYLGRSDERWTNTRALLLLMAEASTDDSETGEHLAIYNQRVLGFLEQHFHAGIANGDIRSDIDPASGATVIVGALRGVLMQKLLKNSSINLDAVKKELLSMMIRSFARKPAKWLTH